MSLRRSPGEIDLSVKTGSLSCTQLAIMTSHADNSNDSIDIEDLDLADLEMSPSSVRTCSPLPAENFIEQRANYPDIDATDFFGEELPAVVSEACLMNDLYILVKIPSNPKNHRTLTTTGCQTSPTSSRHSPRLCMCSNRVIFPIQEEVDEHSYPEPRSRIPIRMKPKPHRRPCWGRETDISEEFVSKTNIVRTNELVPLPNQVPIEPVEHIDECPTTETSSSSPCPNQIELQEVNLNSNQFSSHMVSLENYGILITPTKAPKTENLLVFQVDTETNGNQQESTKVSCFQWFTKFFRRKRRRSPCVQAKVYKTYFVKWKKCSDENQCSRCQNRQVRSCRRNST